MRSCKMFHAHMYSSRDVLGLSMIRCKYSMVMITTLSVERSINNALLVSWDAVELLYYSIIIA
jgi:hypothetical protein